MAFQFGEEQGEFVYADDPPSVFPPWRTDASRGGIRPRPAPPRAAPPVSDNSLPTDVAALHSIIQTLLADAKATNSVNMHLAATVGRLEASQSPPASTPDTTTADFTPAAATADSTPTPTPSTILPHPPLHNPRTIASGRGCASPELFQELIKTNWHGRLGRAHMVDVDALHGAALSELDCLVRRKLHAIFPRGGAFAAPDADTIFASLAALGLRLEDRGAYADLPIAGDNTLQDHSTLRRGTNFSAFYASKGHWGDYWRGVALETLLELARYRGLLDAEEFIKKE